ncbi:MAG: GxxExxY protein [Gammaproteobacteria bacterium]
MIEAREGLMDEVIALASEVHRTLGPGLVAPVYAQALQQELALAGLRGERRSIAVSYKGSTLASGLDADLVVEDSLVLEVKAIERFSTLHVAQLVSYLRLLGIRRGLLVNFNAIALKSGIRRISV